MLRYRTYDITWYWTCVYLFCNFRYKRFYFKKMTLAATFVLDTILTIGLLPAWPTLLKYCLTKYLLHNERNTAILKIYLTNYQTRFVGVYSYRLDWQVTTKTHNKIKSVKTPCWAVWLKVNYTLNQCYINMSSLS